MTSTPIKVEKMTYEQALAELEQVVAGLETSQPSLEDSIRLFERGQALVQRCSTLLDEAELKLRQTGESRDLSDG